MKLLAAILFLTIPIVTMGQLITNAAQTPTALVQGVLQGQGVSISNVTFNGSNVPNSAFGYFTANGTNLGITEGIILTTGTVLNGPNGPHGPNTQEGAGMNNGAGGYAPLTNLNGGTPTFNAAVLEFDFETCSDSISFNYVFGSEEYLEYVYAGFNDVFGFFISGPGIAGQQNIATLPNGTVVAIDNIHVAGTNVNGNSFGALNAQYYVDNAGGATIQYDGFTKKLTARAAVQCNQTYHLIIAIADTGDEVWDSGIFLEANSFTANTPIDLSHTISLNVFNNTNIIAEGCVTTTLTIERSPCGLNLPMNIPIIVSGTAIEGVDYGNIPNSISFAAGVQQTQFSFDSFQDGLVEGLETLNLEFLVTDNCGNQTTETLNLFIQDVNPVLVDVTGAEIKCPGETIELIASATGGVAPYSFSWNTGESTPSIFVSPTSTQVYTVTVIDNCLSQPVSFDYTVVVPNIPPLVLNQTPDITEICPYLPALLESNASGGTPPYTYQWSSNFDPDLGTASTLMTTPSTTTTYTVSVVDFCGMIATEDIIYTITSPPLVLIMSPDVEICPSDSIQISVNSSGGYGQHFYNWLHLGETAPQIWINPNETTTYTVSVSDECQTFTVEGSIRVVVVAPVADFTTTSNVFFNDLPIQFQNLSQSAITYEWDFGDGNSSTFVHPTNTFDEPGTYYVTLVAEDDKGCTDTITKPIHIEEEWYVYVPNTFTPDGDRSNTVFKVSTIGVSELHIDIYNRWGELIFTAYDPGFEWDGTYNGAYVQDGTYTYKLDFTTNSRRHKTLTGHINVLK